MKNKSQNNNVKKYVVYLHIFPNNKHYVGITCLKPVSRRWRCGSSYKSQPKMYNAILKYGWENIKHKILFSDLTLEEANKKEIECIKLYDSVSNGYNVSTGGGGTNGIHCKEETKIKIGNANRGKKKSEKSRNNLKKYILEHGAWNKGKKLSKEHLEKITAERKARCNKKIYALDVKTMEIIKEFSSCTEASIFMNVSKSNISRCCKGHRPTCAGYKWRYANEDKN